VVPSPGGAPPAATPAGTPPPSQEFKVVVPKTGGKPIVTPMPMPAAKKTGQ
jgi:hypothetical protein